MNSRLPICGAGMDFDSGEEARHLREPSRQQQETMVPQPVIDAVKPHRVQPRVAQENFQARLGGGVALQHAWPRLHELRLQDEA